MRPSGTVDIGVVTDGTAVAARASIVTGGCVPVTAMSLTTISLIVALPSEEKSRESNNAVYVPSGTLARASPRTMNTKPANFRPSSMFISTPNAKRKGPPVFEMPSRINVVCGKCGMTAGALGASSDMPVTDPNMALVAGQPASESSIAWFASAAPNTRAEALVRYPVAWPARLDVIVTPGRAGRVPGSKVSRIGIRSPNPAALSTDASNKPTSRYRPR